MAIGCSHAVPTLFSFFAPSDTSPFQAVRWMLSPPWATWNRYRWGFVFVSLAFAFLGIPFLNLRGMVDSQSPQTAFRFDGDRYCIYDRGIGGTDNFQIRGNALGLSVQEDSEAVIQ